MSDIGHYVGLDLGQAQEFTALAVLQKQEGSDPEGTGNAITQYAVRHLERFPMGTPYRDICTRTRALIESAALTRSMLVVDGTAVGKPVIDLFRKAKITSQFRRVTITAGHEVTRASDASRMIPKKELVSTLQVLLQGRRLEIASSLDEAETLMPELTQFRMKTNLVPNENFESWRERDHADLVLAVAIAVWMGERGTRQFKVWV